MLKKLAYTSITISAVVLLIIFGWQFLTVKELPLMKLVDPTTLRATTEGDYVGFIDNRGSRAWLGIPFAKPPIGDLRWKAPVPPTPHSGVKEALDIGDGCPQFANALGPTTVETADSGVVGSEDCLYLNIWSAPNSVKRPVMVWIHGGGNSIGHGGSYNGAVLATTENVVVVTINYRLGILGWFQHPAVLEGNRFDRSGNFGTLDTVRALEWVRQNISEFGGDPENVTIFGESAGGVNVLALVASPVAKGLFHKAIVQSGMYQPEFLNSARNARDEGGQEYSATEMVKKWLIKDGSASDEQSVQNLLQSWSSDKLAYYLRNLSTSRMFSVLTDANFGMLPVPTVTQDGYVIPQAENEDIFTQPGQHNGTPIILGTNRDEPTLFMFQSPRYVDSTLGIFNSLKDENDYLREVYYRAMQWKAMGVDSLANYFHASGNPNVYAYRFDWDEEPSIFGFDLSTAIGAGHGLEINFVFGTFTDASAFSQVYPNDENQYQLSSQMMSYWAEFAYTGDPGTGRKNHQPKWLSWKTEGKTTLLLDTETDGGIRMDDAIVTIADLKKELVSDAGFNQNTIKCETYVYLVYGTDEFDQAEYESLGCGELNPSSVSFYARESDS